MEILLIVCAVLLVAVVAVVAVLLCAPSIEHAVEHAHAAKDPEPEPASVRAAEPYAPLTLSADWRAETRKPTRNTGGL